MELDEAWMMLERPRRCLADEFLSSSWGYSVYVYVCRCEQTSGKGRGGEDRNRGYVDASVDLCMMVGREERERRRRRRSRNRDGRLPGHYELIPIFICVWEAGANSHLCSYTNRSWEHGPDQGGKEKEKIWE